METLSGIDICNKDEITRVMAEVNEDRDMLMAVPAVKAAYDSSGTGFRSDYAKS